LPTFSIISRPSLRGVSRVEGGLDHRGVEVAALAGVDLQRGRAGGADAVGVVAGLLVALDHGHGHAAGQRWMVRTSSVVLPEPGLETRFKANTPALLHPHLRAALHLKLVTAAARAGVVALRHRHGLAALHAPAAAGDGDDLQRGALGDATARHRVEAEAHRLGLDAGQRADLQPHRLHAREARFRRLVLDDLQDALGKAHLMH
jgi:hypothetical protein